MPEQIGHLSNRVGIWSLRDLQDHYERKHAGTGRGHWFEPETMAFFKSRLSDGLIYSQTHIYFISSEKGPDTVRRYSIREYDPATGEINTVGLGFQGYKTAVAAKLAAYKIAGAGNA